VHFHSHDRGKLSAALLLGVLLAYLIGFIEPEHDHSHLPLSPSAQVPVERP
jgi:zinc and cadmium transporter